MKCISRVTTYLFDWNGQRFKLDWAGPERKAVYKLQSSGSYEHLKVGDPERTGLLIQFSAHKDEFDKDTF